MDSASFSGYETQPLPDMADALELLHQKVLEETRANDLKEQELKQQAEELEEFKRENELKVRHDAWVRELATQAGRNIEDQRAFRIRIIDLFESLEATIREQGEEQARTFDYLVEGQRRIRDVLVYILSRVINGDKEAKRFRELVTDYPANPEYQEEYEAIKEQLKIRGRNLRQLEKTEALGNSSLEVQNSIRVEKEEIEKLEERLKKLQ